MTTITNNTHSNRFRGSSALLALFIGVLGAFVMGIATPNVASAVYYGDCTGCGYDYSGGYDYDYGSNYGYDYSGGYDYGYDSNYGYDYSGGYDYNSGYDYSGGYNYDYGYNSGYDYNSSYNYGYDSGSYYYPTTYTYNPYYQGNYYYESYYQGSYVPPYTQGTYYHPPQYDQPNCVLEASRTSITDGQSVTLSWTAQDADDATLTGFGSVSATSGSKTVTPHSTKTYTLEVSGQGGSDTCQVTIRVTTAHQNISCDITASDTSIDRGDSTTLDWDTDNADDVRIDHGIGSVSDSGTKRVSPTTTTTYTLTARNDAGDQQTCDVTVRVKQSSRLSCDLTASATRITRGDSATLRWDNDGADDARINQGIGSVDEDSGSTRVYPTSDTTYRLTVENDDGDTDTCDVTIRVDTGLTPPPDVPLVYLSQLPYTGLELDPGSMMAYLLVLIGGGGLLGYFLFFRALPFALARAKAEGETQTHSEASENDAPAAPASVTRQDVRAFVSALSEGDIASARDFMSSLGGTLMTETAVVLDDVVRARASGSVADPQVAAMTARFDTAKLERMVASFANDNADEAFDIAKS